MTGQAQQRAAAVLEVFGVYLAAGLVTNQLIRLFGVSVTNPFNNLTAQITGPELITASRQVFVLLMFQYAGYFLLILPINWWHRRRGHAAYGLTKAGHSWATLLRAGLGTAAFSEWLVQYQIPSAYNAGMIVGLLLSAIGFGVVFAWTRSLIPAIIAHAVFDIPMTPTWESLLVAALVIGALFSWRRGLAIIRHVFSTRSGVAYLTLAVLGTVYAIAAARVRSLEYVAVGLVALAVLFEWVDSNRAKLPITE